MRIGIFFGGSSREREISFAGGRTVYDNLDKSLFQAVPIFVDSFGNFILLKWEYLYKGSIRDFYPHPQYLPQHGDFADIQIYAESLAEHSSPHQLAEGLGERVLPHQLAEHIDFAFLALHGAYGEDGSIQGLLQFLKIPYSGSGILPSAIGMNKVFQKQHSRRSTRFAVISRRQWHTAAAADLFEHCKKNIGLPLVLRPANQGSSIGVSIINHHDDAPTFMRGVEQAFFIKRIEQAEWAAKNRQEKLLFIKNLCDIRHQIGLPLYIGDKLLYTPEAVFNVIEAHFLQDTEPLLLEAADKENEVLVEEFIAGKEFSCIVLRDDEGRIVALPPTEIRKGGEVYDYRSKYLAGLSSKVTPIELPDAQINAIRRACVRLFEQFRFNVYARIDGFIRHHDQAIILNDPNTTSGMLPSSFFFHQAAEVGLNPSQFLTFIIRNSLHERAETLSQQPRNAILLQQLDKALEQQKSNPLRKQKIGVVLGGYSAERHISVESGRNIYEKLASSTQYDPIPYFLYGSEQDFSLYQIPINILLKDNADDIAQKIENYHKSPLLERIIAETRPLRHKYGGAVLSAPQKVSLETLAKQVQVVFIALHGRPGEDGHLQSQLQQFGIAYNGSGVESSQITIDKYACNNLLEANGFAVAARYLAQKTDWQNHAEAFYRLIENKFSYPFIAKPHDDGCSAAVKVIRSRAQLAAYTQLIFRENAELGSSESAVLKLQPKEEFPQKQQFLAETLIQPDADTRLFMEITGGMLVKGNDKQRDFEVFEPSETLANAEVLSLEEKFLAGEGQNITPARFAADAQENRRISEAVRRELQRAATVLGVQGYCRIDAFVKVSNAGAISTYIIEVNSLPGMTPATCIFHQAAIHHYKPYQFIDKIIQYSLERQ